MRVIGFTKARKITYALSTVAIVAMFIITFTVNGGFRLGIDFEPGVSVQVAVDTSVKAPIEVVRKALEGKVPAVQVQHFGTEASQHYTIRVRAYEETEGYAVDMAKTIKSAVAAVAGEDKVELLATASVGSRFSQTLTQQAFVLVGLAVLLIMVYIWIRFKLGYAIAAGISTLHNVLFMVGFIGLVRMDVTSSTIASVLTIVGYCLNDTIVVFDRIRENEKLMAEQKLGFIYDSSITQTLSRTIVTAFTVLLAVFSIWIFTWDEIKDFAAVLMCGVIVGTYSSIAIASPVLLDWRTMAIKRRKVRNARIEGKPEEAIELARHGEQTASEVAEVDADAVAEELRRQRQDKKKY